MKTVNILSLFVVMFVTLSLMLPDIGFILDGYAYVLAATISSCLCWVIGSCIEHVISTKIFKKLSNINAKSIDGDREAVDTDKLIIRFLLKVFISFGVFWCFMVVIFIYTFSI